MSKEKNLRRNKKVCSHLSIWKEVALVCMCMVKPEDELPGTAEHILSLRISGWDSQTGIYLPVKSLKHTPVPDCVAMLSSLWERNSVKTVLPHWT